MVSGLPISVRMVSMVNLSLSLLSFVTLVFRKNVTPFVKAFSANAIVMWNGQTIPPVGAKRAQVTSSLKFGSRAISSSRSKIRSPGTPFFSPFSSKVVSPLLSWSLVQTTRDPFLLKGMSSSLESCSISSFPRTFKRAFKVPGVASKPAWIMALLAFEVPQQTSSSRSMTQVFT